MADGFKITIGILVGILFAWTLIQTLQISSVQSNMYNTYAQKYEITSLTDRIKTVENKMTYEVPTKYTTDQHQIYLDALSRNLDALTTRVGKCACSW